MSESIFDKFSALLGRYGVIVKPSWIMSVNYDTEATATVEIEADYDSDTVRNLVTQLSLLNWTYDLQYSENHPRVFCRVVIPENVTLEYVRGVPKRD